MQLLNKPCGGIEHFSLKLQCCLLFNMISATVDL